MDCLRTMPAARLAIGALLFSVIGLVVPARAEEEARSKGSAASTGVAQGTEDSAVRLERGTIAQRQVVAVGRDLEVYGEARESAVAIGGTVTISGEVRGNVIALGGSVILTEGASVGGDVCALGGELELGEGATVGGRSLAYPNAPSALLLLLEGPALGLSPLAPVVLAAKLSLIAVWMLVALAILRFFPRPMGETVETVSEEPFRCFFAGLTAALGGVMVIVLLSAILAPIVGVPLVGLVGLLALMLKLWGLVAVFGGLGRWLILRLPSRSTLRAVLPIQATLVGLLTLSVLKLMPYVGTWAWTVVSLVGIGAALISRFGQGAHAVAV